MSLTKLLLLSKNFMPETASGIRRIKSIYHILLGIKTIDFQVITAAGKAKNYKNVTYLKQLLFKDKPYNFSTGSFEYKRANFRFLSKGMIGWVPNVLRKIFFQKIDIIYATVPSFEPALIGFLYKIFFHRHTRLIIEYRDLYSFDPSLIKSLSLKIASILEKYILNKTNYIVVTTEGMRKKLSNYMEKSKIYLIRNYISQNDAYQISGMEKLNFDDNHFHIGYVGILNTGRDPKLLLKLLDLKIDEKKCKIHFVGLSPQDERKVKEFVKFLKLDESRLLFHGIVDRNKSLQFMKSFDGLFLLINPIAKISDGFGIPGKLYDYLWSGARIFSDMGTYENLKTDIEIQVTQKYNDFIEIKINDKMIFDHVFKEFIRDIIPETV